MNVFVLLLAIILAGLPPFLLLQFYVEKIYFAPENGGKALLISAYRPDILLSYFNSVLIGTYVILANLKVKSKTCQV